MQHFQKHKKNLPTPNFWFEWCDKYNWTMNGNHEFNNNNKLFTHSLFILIHYLMLKQSALGL